MKKQETKKQVRQNAVIWLVISLMFSLGAIGFVYWDYREQVKIYYVFERGINTDFKTGKPIPNYQPKPFKFRFDRMAFLPYIIIIGSGSLLTIFLAVSEFRKSAKMVETPEMLAADAEREKIENLPEVKNKTRQNLILKLLPFILLIPVPFIAIYKLGAVVFAVYMGFVAIVILAAYYFVPRWMSNRR